MQNDFGANQAMTTSAPPIQAVLDCLYDTYGRPEYTGPDDLLGTLIRTIISQQTTSDNASDAFAELLDRFGGSWARMQHAHTDELADAIDVAGLAGQKARRIHRILNWLDEHRSEFSLEWLRQESTDDARDFLTEFRGVGPKTASFTLMDAAGMPFFPMDTHILRICERLGWIDDQSNNQQAHDTMLPRIPDGEHYPAHIVLVEHGRQTCHAQNPDCASCPLQHRCPFSD
jgi:endonuclease-3